MFLSCYVLTYFIFFPFCYSLGTFLEIDARNQSIQSSIDRWIEEVRRDEILAIIVVSREHIINFKGQISYLTRQIDELIEEAA